ncbi:MAG: hypothetical protein OXG51_10465 [Gammaproteobacteria bacterium]|nr:hypothetical protein [Gammaproteobacteria bacterium]
MRAKAEALMERLAAVSDPPWATADFTAAETLQAEGMALYRDEYFGDAAAKFQAALARLEAIDTDFEELVQHKLAEGEALLAAEQHEQAAAEFEAILNWMPQSVEATQGLATVHQGAEARVLLGEANQLIDQGEFAAAEQRLNAIPPGQLIQGVGESRARIEATRRQDRYSRSMSAGYRHLDGAEWALAEAAFAEALRAKPKSTAAQDALQDLRRQRSEAELARLGIEVEAELEDQNWPAAQALLQRIRALAPNDARAVDGLARVDRLADVERRIDAHLAAPQRLSTKGVRDQVAALLADAQARDDHGSRIDAKLLQLREVFEAWTQRVKLTLRSDNRTEARISPGRALGKFKELQLEVFPGNYVAIGRRAGFREVRLPVAVPPGSPPLTFEVVCNERF